MSMETGTAIAVAGLVPSIYGLALPSLADVRAKHDERGHLAASERYAAVVAASTVLSVAVLARSPEAGAVGLVVLVGVAAAYHFAVNAQP